MMVLRKLLCVILLGLIYLHPQGIYGEEIELPATALFSETVLRDGHSDIITGFIWDPVVENRLYSIDIGGSMIAWNTRDKRIVWKVDLSDRGIGLFAIDIADDGCCLVVGGSQSYLATYNTLDGEVISEGYQSGRPFDSIYRTVSLHPEGGLMTGESNGYIDFWQLELSTPVYSTRAHDWPIKKGFFSKSGRFAVTIDPTKVLLWDVLSGDLVSDISEISPELTEGGFWFGATGLSEEEDYLAVINNEGVYLYDFVSDTLVAKIPGAYRLEDEESPPVAITLDSRSGTALVAAGSAGFLTFDFDAGTAVSGFVDYRLQLGCMSSVAYDPKTDGKFAAARANLKINIFTGEIEMNHVINLYQLPL